MCHSPYVYGLANVVAQIPRYVNRRKSEYDTGWLSVAVLEGCLMRKNTDAGSSNRP